MTKEEYTARTVAQIKAAFSHRAMPSDVGTSAEALWFAGRAADDLTSNHWSGREIALHGFTVEAFTYYLQSVLRTSITSAGFPRLVRVLLNKLDRSHDQRFEHLNRLTRYELQAIRHCLHLLSYRDEIGDGPVRMPMKTVVSVRPTIH